MIYKLELTTDEARFLRSQLTKHANELDDELIHTDKYELQHELHGEVEKLRAIEHRLEALLEKSEVIA
jgi:hypothetical protein